MNVAQQKIVNLLKHCEIFFAITCRNVFSVWPKTTLLPVWPRVAKRLDALEGGTSQNLPLRTVVERFEKQRSP